jgi:hypothetical protein
MQRDVLILSGIYGYSHVEIAPMLGEWPRAPARRNCTGATKKGASD